ncbi:uncharacterized protein LOC113640476 [Tachysurus fulvidraco]|uniref:uncharacterized protein LOC113640476 n=1 Tax=Tachysurus fulvidraco TaxID=1234273 RepID=UPI001FF05DF0|nr:uncharacterized protein LOC113640476 [Tachysurus fulvidraco]
MENSQRLMFLFLGLYIFSMQWLQTHQQVDLALRGIATQSSTYYIYNASRAIDGKKTSNLTSRSCTHTYHDYNPWWRVDLLAVYDINKVIVTNRGDCCPERINGAEIHIGNSLINNGNNNPRCAIISSIPAGASANYTCNMQGRYVNIILPGVTQYLTLCEVEVYGVQSYTLNLFQTPDTKKKFFQLKFNSSEDLSNPIMRDKVLQKVCVSNVALGLIATQSSVHKYYTALFAIAAKHLTSPYVTSLHFTNADNSQYWSVDLLTLYDVSKVIITNRGDCCAEWIDGPEINIGNSLINNGNNNPRCVVISSIPAGACTNYICKMQGHYVNFIIPGSSHILTLCEAEVYGVQVPVTKKTFLRLKFKSSEDLSNPTMREVLL